MVTDASVHDSQVLGQLLDEDNSSDTVWADSAYRSDAIEETLNLLGFDSQIHERGYRNHPLTEEQKLSNRSKSKTRAKVEHVFGTWVMQMGGCPGAFYRHRQGKGTIGIEEFDLQLDSLHVFGNQNSWLRENSGRNLWFNLH